MNEPMYPSAEAETPEPAKPRESEGDTALLPKSLFKPEVKAGDTCEFEVVHVYEDEVEVKYHGSESAQNEGSESEPNEMDSANAKIDAMAQ